MLFKIGETNFRRFETEGLSLDEAVDAFEKAIISDEAGNELEGRSHLWMGKIFDAGNQRAEALQQYKAVLALDCAENLEREARDYRRRPYKG